MQCSKRGIVPTAQQVHSTVHRRLLGELLKVHQMRTRDILIYVLSQGVMRRVLLRTVLW